MNANNPRITSALAIALVAFGLGTAAPESRAAEFPEAELYFELNDSAGDLGIHSSIDGPANLGVTILDPKGRVLLNINPHGPLARQGLTQLFFESAEPTFDQLAPADFFARFPEGEYKIRGRTLAGELLESDVELSQVMAARPGNITANGVAAVNCDVLPLPSVRAPVLIEWDPVTTSHPTVGIAGSVEIERYEFFVEREGVKMGVELPPNVTFFEIPAEILALGDTFKYEIIARTSTGNNTAVEACFSLLP